MNSFTELLKRSRKQAGLTQAQLAEKLNVTVITIQNWEKGRTKVELSHLQKLSYCFNIPVDVLIKEMIAQENCLRPITWPSFLFDEHTNEIVRTLHLNLKQQDLFGVLYIYKAEYLQKKWMDSESIQSSLSVVPFEYINKVGSIQFLNIADGLEKVLRYVQTDFLMKALRISPEEEFDVCRLNKNLICEFINSGYKQLDEVAMECAVSQDEALFFNLNVNYAREILPILENEPLYIGDMVNGHIERSSDWPEEILQTNRIKEIFRLNKNHISTLSEQALTISHTISYGLTDLAQHSHIKKADGAETIQFEITEKGRSLLKWFRDEE